MVHFVKSLVVRHGIVLLCEILSCETWNGPLGKIFSGETWDGHLNKCNLFNTTLDQFSI